MRIKLHLIFGQDMTNVTKPMQLLANWWAGRELIPFPGFFIVAG